MRRLSDRTPARYREPDRLPVRGDELPQMPDLHQIVIVGGGAGGLELATRLGDKLGRRRQALVTLIDRSRTHLWKPLLHEFAAGTMDLDHHALDYLAQARWHHFRFQLGEMDSLDRVRKVVKVAPTHDRSEERRVGKECRSRWSPDH